MAFKLGAIFVNDTLSRLHTLAQPYMMGFASDQDDGFYYRKSTIGLEKVASEYSIAVDGTKTYRDINFAEVNFGTTDETRRAKIAYPSTGVRLGDYEANDKTSFYIETKSRSFTYIPDTTGGFQGAPASRGFEVGIDDDVFTGINLVNEQNGSNSQILIHPDSLFLSSQVTGVDILLNNNGLSFGDNTGFTRSAGNMISNELLVASEQPTDSSSLNYMTYGSNYDGGNLQDTTVTPVKLDQYAYSYSKLYITSGSNGDTSIDLTGLDAAFQQNGIVDVIVNCVVSPLANSYSYKQQEIDFWEYSTSGNTLDITIAGSGLIFSDGTSGTVEVTVITRDRQGQ